MILLVKPLRERWTFSVRDWLAFVVLLALSLGPVRSWVHDRQVQQLVAARDDALRAWRQVKQGYDRGAHTASEEVEARDHYFHIRREVELAQGGAR